MKFAQFIAAAVALRAMGALAAVPATQPVTATAGNFFQVLLGLVVEVAGQWIVVGVAAGQVSALTTMPRPEQIETAESAPLQKNFSAWLRQTIDKRNGQ
jgi:hypothetical protein